MKGGISPIYMNQDAQRLQCAISPGEEITSIRELTYRVFGDTTPASHARLFRAVVRLHDMGRLIVETDGKSITRIVSLDTKARGFQFAACLNRFAAPLTT